MTTTQGNPDHWRNAALLHYYIGTGTFDPCRRLASIAEDLVRSRKILSEGLRIAVPGSPTDLEVIEIALRRQGTLAGAGALVGWDLDDRVGADHSGDGIVVSLRTTLPEELVGLRASTPGLSPSAALAGVLLSRTEARALARELLDASDECDRLDPP